jgi:hypothetical protein
MILTLLILPYPGDHAILLNVKPQASFKRRSKSIHSKMAPVRGGRSADRIEFCKEVNQKARQILEEYISHQDFLNSTQRSAIRFALKGSKNSPPLHGHRKATFYSQGA